MYARLRPKLGKSTLVPALSFAGFLLVSAGAEAQSLPQGWEVRGDNQGALFSPQQPGAGELMEIWIAPPTALTNRASLADQLSVVRKQTGATQGSNCQPVGMLSSGAASQICENGSSVLQYMLLPPDRTGLTQLVRIRLAGNNTLTRYQDGMQKIIALAMNGDAQRVLTRYGKSERQIERERIAKAIRTEPGQGVQARDIADFFVAWEDRPVPGSTMNEVVHTAYLMFKDGTAYEELDIPPDEFNASVSRQLQPDRWGQWRRSGSAYEVLDANGEWKELKGWQALPAREDERLNGSYSRMSGSGTIYTGVSTSSTSWRFTPDGRFETSNYSTSGTGSMQAANGFNSSSSTLSNGQGTSSTTGVLASGSNDRNADPVVAGGDTTRRNDGSANTGRYRLSGWVMEILRDNGVYERLLISFPNAKRDAIDIEGQSYRVD